MKRLPYPFWQTAKRIRKATRQEDARGQDAGVPTFQAYPSSSQGKLQLFLQRLHHLIGPSYASQSTATTPWPSLESAKATEVDAAQQDLVIAVKKQWPDPATTPSDVKAGVEKCNTVTKKQITKDLHRETGNVDRPRRAISELQQAKDNHGHAWMRHIEKAAEAWKAQITAYQTQQRESVAESKAQPPGDSRSVRDPYHNRRRRDECDLGRRTGQAEAQKGKIGRATRRRRTWSEWTCYWTLWLQACQVNCGSTRSCLRNDLCVPKPQRKPLFDWSVEAYGAPVWTRHCPASSPTISHLLHSINEEEGCIHPYKALLDAALIHGDVLLGLHNPTIFLSLISDVAPDGIFPTVSSTRPQFFPWHKLRRANDTPVAERLQAEGHQLQHPAPAGPLRMFHQMLQHWYRTLSTFCSKMPHYQSMMTHLSFSALGIFIMKPINNVRVHDRLKLTLTGSLGKMRSRMAGETVYVAYPDPDRSYLQQAVDADILIVQGIHSPRRAIHPMADGNAFNVHIMDDAQAIADSTAEGETAQIDLQVFGDDDALSANNDNDYDMISEHNSETSSDSEYLHGLHVHRLQRASAHIFVTWHTYHQILRDIAQIFYQDIRNMLGFHYLEAYPEDQIEGEDAVIAQYQNDIEPGSREKLVLIDVEIHAQQMPGEMQQAPRIHRKVHRLQPAITRQQLLLQAALVDGYCLIQHDRCLVSMNHQLWPFQDIQLRDIRHGTYFRINIPPPMHGQMRTQRALDIAEELSENIPVNLEGRMYSCTALCYTTVAEAATTSFLQTEMSLQTEQHEHARTIDATEEVLAMPDSPACRFSSTPPNH